MPKAPACPGSLKSISNPPPFVYWRVVGVALVTASLFIITTMLAIKAWANGKRSGPSLPETAAKQVVLPILVEPEGKAQEAKASPEPGQRPALKKEESEIAPIYPEKLERDPPKLPVKSDEKKTEVASAPAINNPPAAPAPAVFKRRDFRNEEDLRKELVQIPIFRTNQVPVKSLFQLAMARKDKKYTPDMMPDFKGLPMRMGVDCQLGKEPAENLHVLSQKLRAGLVAAVAQGGLGGNDPRPNEAILRTVLLGEGGKDLPSQFQVALNQLQPKPAEWVQPEAVPALLQMLMAENKPLRLLLVELLARNPSREAGIALAQRALFDLSPEVREAAVLALKTRPIDQSRETLVNGFRYPWTPINDHAAEALVALDAKETIRDLVSMLGEPSPTSPFPGKSGKKDQVHELVRISHLSNCTFCHPRSFSSTDLVRGQVPDPNQTLSPGMYQQARSMSFVRASETYLRQDFSVTQPVHNPGPWPAFQRFDYVVRKRPLTVNEEIFGNIMDAASKRQRQALLFALRELTGKDAGNTAFAWRQMVAEVEKPAPNGFN
jgi:hypothetical protein